MSYIALSKQTKKGGLTGAKKSTSQGSFSSRGKFSGCSVVTWALTLSLANATMLYSASFPEDKIPKTDTAKTSTLRTETISIIDTVSIISQHLSIFQPIGGGGLRILKKHAVYIKLHHGHISVTVAPKHIDIM